MIASGHHSVGLDKGYQPDHAAGENHAQKRQRKFVKGYKASQYARESGENHRQMKFDEIFPHFCVEWSIDC